MNETINFYIEFESVFWDQPPKATILINDQTMFDGIVDQEKFTVEFSATLEFNQTHTLYIKRYNKIPGQCMILSDGSLQDQILILKKLKIDGIDIQHLVNTTSYNCPDYPEPWATEQRTSGVKLEEKILAETYFGHNGVWSMALTSPFYKFLYKNIG